MMNQMQLNARQKQQELKRKRDEEVVEWNRKENERKQKLVDAVEQQELSDLVIEEAQKILEEAQVGACLAESDVREIQRDVVPKPAHLQRIEKLLAAPGAASHSRGGAAASVPTAAPSTGVGAGASASGASPSTGGGAAASASSAATVGTTSPLDVSFRTLLGVEVSRVLDAMVLLFD